MTVPFTQSPKRFLPLSSHFGRTDIPTTLKSDVDTLL